MAITSLKSIDDIDKPPGYLPFGDYIPSLDAWRFIFFAQNEPTLSMSQKMTTKPKSDAFIEIEEIVRTLQKAGDFYRNSRARNGIYDFLHAA